MSSPVGGRRRSRDRLQQMDAAAAAAGAPAPATSDGRVVVTPRDAHAERRARVIRAHLLDSISTESNRRRKRARAAASSDDAVLGLQEVRAGGIRVPEECAVCLQDFTAEETLRAMPCSHTFHQDCILRWLRVNRVCPLCRHALPTQQHTDDEDEDEGEEEEYDQGNSELDDIINEYYQQYYGDEHYYYGGEYYHQESMPVQQEAA